MTIHGFHVYSTKFWHRAGGHEQPYLTIQDVAARWKISVPTVRRMIARGEVSPVRIGRVVRIEYGEIEFREGPPKPTTTDPAQEAGLSRIWDNPDDEVWNDA